jgi:hypothetical protein
VPRPLFNGLWLAGAPRPALAGPRDHSVTGAAPPGRRRPRPADFPNKTSSSLDCAIPAQNPAAGAAPP